MDRNSTDDLSKNKRSGMGLILRNCLLVLGLFLISFSATIARQSAKSVSGTVTSVSDNSPIPGVVVLVKGTNQGTVTDLDGK
ncbi:MAG TPA: hypothetical protein DHU93_06795, partial [Algoriphagus sp.]|nr:hypothetical protein [Algoriphagus sp.]